MAHPPAETPRFRPALRMLIGALLLIFLVETTLLVLVARGALGEVGPALLAAGAVLLLGLAPRVWEQVILARPVAPAAEYPSVVPAGAPMVAAPGSDPVRATRQRAGRRAWTAPRPRGWELPPEPRHWFSPTAPRITGWVGGSNANFASDPGASLKSG